MSSSDNTNPYKWLKEGQDFKLTVEQGVKNNNYVIGLELGLYCEFFDKRDILDLRNDHCQQH